VNAPKDKDHRHAEIGGEAIYFTFSLRSTRCLAHMAEVDDFGESTANPKLRVKGRSMIVERSRPRRRWVETTCTSTI
jgi:hypothetical protein